MGVVRGGFFIDVFFVVCLRFRNSHSSLGGLMLKWILPFPRVFHDVLRICLCSEEVCWSIGVVLDRCLMFG